MRLENYRQKFTRVAEIKLENLKQSGRQQPEAAIGHRAMVEMSDQGYGIKDTGGYFNGSKRTAWNVAGVMRY